MPPVKFCLLRGLGRESAHWGSFASDIRKLQNVAAVACIDLPGAGRFHQLTSPLSIQENAEFVMSQLPENEDQWVIVSVSMGSMVALEMLRLHPERFSQAYLMNTSISNLSPFYHRLQLSALRRFWAIARSSTLEEREMECLKMVSQRPENWVKLSTDFAQAARERPMKLSNFLRQLMAAARFKVAVEPPSLPIHVLRSLGDTMVHPSCSQALANHWNLPLHTHAWSGHDIAIDAPEWILEVIEQTLQG